MRVETTSRLILGTIMVISGSPSGSVKKVSRRKLLQEAKTSLEKERVYSFSLHLIPLLFTTYAPQCFHPRTE